MGKKVNVVLWDGQVAAVDEEVANRLIGRGKAHAESVTEEAGRLTQQYNQENTSGVRAFVEGVADTLTLGAYGALNEMGSEDGGFKMRATAEAHPGARTFGEIAGIAAPIGLLGQTAKVATAFTPMGAADKLGRVVGGLRGQALEGAIVGVGGTVARTNVTGDPLTIEAALLDAGIGAVAGVGTGLLAGKLKTRGALAETELTVAKEAEEQAVQVAKGKQLFEHEYPSLTELNHARKASISAAEDVNKGIQKGNDAHAEFIASPKKFRGVMKGVDDAINTVRSRYRPEGTFGSVDEALAAAQQRAGVRADELNLDARGQPPRQAITGGPSGTSVAVSRGGLTPEGVPTKITDRVKLDDRMPMSPEVAERLTKWQREASEIRQLFAGGRKIDGNKWSKFDPSVPRNPDEAIVRLHALKKEIWEHAQDAAGKIPDTIPSLPQKLLDVAPEVPAIKNLDYLSRMHTDSIAKIANTLSKEEAAAVERLARDLDLKPKGTPGDTLASIHAELQNYRKLMDAAELAEKESKAAASTGFGKLMFHASRLVGARAGNRLLGGGVFGGAIGWAAGNMFGGIVGGVLGSALMNNRAGLRGKITDLFAKHGAKAGRVVEKLGPVTASLAVRFNGETESGKYEDIRRLAKRRAQELQNFRGVAGDAGYLAFEPFMQAENDIALKLHSKWFTAMTHLADVAPKDPGLSLRGFESSWVPTFNQAMEFAHRYEAVFEPFKAITRALQGGGHPAAADTLWTVWAGVMGTFAEELAFSPETLGKLTHSQLSSFSRLFRTPLSGFQIPEIALAAQAMYQPGGAGNPYENNPGAGFGDSPQDLSQPQGGRPPKAGRSQVAGSNVSRLTE